MLNKGAAKLAAAMACAAIVGAAAAYVSDQRSARSVSAEETSGAKTSARPEPVFHSAPNDCLPTGRASILALDAQPFVIRFPGNEEENFVTRRSARFSVRSVTRLHDGLEAELMVDGRPAKIDIPRSRLWAVRFCAGACSGSVTIPVSTDIYSVPENVAPCAWQQRKDNARLIFGAAFAAMQDGDAMRAKALFEYGLELDPTSSLAWFYYAEAYSEIFGEALRDAEREWYRRALEIGLPAELESIAMERIREEK